MSAVAAARYRPSFSAPYKIVMRGLDPRIHAALLLFQLALLIQAAYTAKDYRWLTAREIRDTQIGYELYQSGRISAGR